VQVELVKEYAEAVIRENELLERVQHICTITKG
jgi:hypothetical protein